MPTAAAALSFDRTASMRRPVPLRIRLVTMMQARVTKTTTKIPKLRRAMLRPSRTPRSRPKIVGFEMRLPLGETKLLLRKTNFSNARPLANVTTASCVPRIRSAGIPTTTPTTIETSTDKIKPSGKLSPETELNFDKANPAVPAIAA